MKKIAVVFPGQGAQYTGMGKDIAVNYEIMEKGLERANQILNFNLKKIIFEGSEQQLSETVITQPAVFTVSVLIWEVFNSLVDILNRAEVFFAGHSLGEYSALCAARIIDFENALKLVQKRAEFISEASRLNPGTMAAVIGMEEENLAQLCNSIREKVGVIEMVNFNCPGQIVVSGLKESINELIRITSGFPKVKIVVLNVSGPFHSSLMKSAAEKLLKEINNIVLDKPSGFFVCNYDAGITKEVERIRENLVKQIDHPVLWEKSMRNIIERNVETFIEIGPGKVLSGMLRRIDKNLKVFNIENIRTLEEVINNLKF